VDPLQLAAATLVPLLSFDSDWHGPPHAGWVVDPGRWVHTKTKSC